MSNFRILARNVTDEAATIAASPSALGSKPVTNLQTQLRSATWRSTGLATQVITLTWSANQRMNLVALTRHNLRTAGTIQVDVYSDTSLSTLLEGSGALAAFSTTGLATLDADDYLAAEFRGLKNFVFHFAALRTTVRGLKITLIDTANADGYMEASRLYAGEFFEAAYQPQYGAENLALMSLTQQVRVDGGGLFSHRLANYRRESIQLDRITDAGDLDDFLAITRRLGLHRDFWFSFYPGLGGAREIYRQGGYKFVDVGAFTPHFVGLHRQDLVMEEL